VRAVGVVVAQVFVEVAAQGSELRDERAGEAGSPAFLEDRQLNAFDAAVGGWAAGLDPPLSGTDGCWGVPEVGGGEITDPVSSPSLVSSGLATQRSMSVERGLGEAPCGRPGVSITS
jgi:hypothetical protein